MDRTLEKHPLMYPAILDSFKRAFTYAFLPRRALLLSLLGLSTSFGCQPQEASFCESRKEAQFYDLDEDPKSWVSTDGTWVVEFDEYARLRALYERGSYFDAKAPRRRGPKQELRFGCEQGKLPTVPGGVNVYLDSDENWTTHQLTNTRIREHAIELEYEHRTENAEPTTTYTSLRFLSSPEQPQRLLLDWYYGESRDTMPLLRSIEFRPLSSE